MVSLKPLLTKQIISSKEKLLTQNRIVQPFTEQSGLICLLRGKLLYDKRNPLKSSACTLKQPFLCSLSSSLLSFFDLVYSYCHIYTGDVCSRSNKLPPWKCTHLRCPVWFLGENPMYDFLCLSIVFLEKLSLCWQHRWWGSGLVWPGGSVLWVCSVQSVTCCTHEQELMPVLKATALSCVFIDLFPLFMVDDLQEHRAESALQ